MDTTIIEDLTRETLFNTYSENPLQVNRKLKVSLNLTDTGQLVNTKLVYAQKQRHL